MIIMRFLMVAALLAIAGAPLQATEGEKPLVEVFTLSDRPIHGVKALERRGMTVNVYVVDTFEQADRRLSAGLPTNEHQAIETATHRIQQQSASLSRRYQQAAQGLMRALSLGLKRIPAVVFDGGKTVVLGVTDLEMAFSIVQPRQSIGRGR